VRLVSIKSLLVRGDNLIEGLEGLEDVEIEG